MTFEEAKRAIEDLGWTVIAEKKHPSGVSYDATNFKRLAKGNAFLSPDSAMTSCYLRVKGYCHG